jgi:hypothetical protein
LRARADVMKLSAEVREIIVIGDVLLEPVDLSEFD